MMGCSVCLDNFSPEGELRPKVLPCGHSFCLRCVRRLVVRQCPVDRKPFVVAPDLLPDNFMLLEMCTGAAAHVTPPRRDGQLQLWCRDCKSEAREVCVEQHPTSLRSLKAEQAALRASRAEVLAPKVAALRSAEEALATLRRELDRQQAAANLDGELGESCERLQRVLDRHAQKRQQLEAAAEADEVVFREALRAAGVDALAENVRRVHDSIVNSEFEMTLKLRDPDDGEWVATVYPEDWAAARLLVFQLLADGELRRDGQPAGGAADSSNLLDLSLAPLPGNADGNAGQQPQQQPQQQQMFFGPTLVDVPDSDGNDSVYVMSP